MAVLKVDQSISVNLQVLPGLHDVIVDYGAPAAMEMTPNSTCNAIQGTTRLNIDSSQRLLDTLRLPLPVTFSLRDTFFEIVDEGERTQIVQSLERAIRSASRIILEIDSPRDLLKPRQRSRGENFCTWPVRLGGHRINHFFCLSADGVVREVVEYDFVPDIVPCRVEEACDDTLSFFADKWRDSCVGQAVFVTLRNEDRELNRAKQVIGAGRELRETGVVAGFTR